MLMVRERIDKWTEDSGMLGEIQKRECMGDNLFMLEKLIEMEEGGDICGISGYGESI